MPPAKAEPWDAVVVALPLAGAAPLDELAGLPLVLRAVLTLQKEGAARCFVLVGEGDGATETELGSDPRVRLALKTRRSASAVAGLSALAGELCGPTLVARHDRVVDPSIYRSLRRAALDGAQACVATEGIAPVGPFVASPALLARLQGDSLDAELERLLGDASTAACDVGAAFHASVATPEGRRKAFEALFEACRKPVDGIVARNINRHISIFLSKRLVGTPITPNAMSTFTFVLAVLGSIAAGRGGYWPTLAGAFLMQCNSILDGVDGELARVRFQHSHFGQWLDTVSDDVSNVLFYAGLGYGARAMPHGRLLAACAAVAIAASVLTMVIRYAELVRVGSGDLYAIEYGFDKAPPPGLAGKLLIFWRNVLKKDFAILFFLALAAVGVLPYALPVIAGGAVGALVADVLRNLAMKRARAGA